MTFVGERRAQAQEPQREPVLQSAQKRLQRCFPTALDRGVETVVGDEGRHHGNDAAALARGEIDPRKGREPGLLDRTVIGPAFGVSRKKRTPLGPRDVADRAIDVGREVRRAIDPVYDVTPRTAMPVQISPIPIQRRAGTSSRRTTRVATSTVM